MTTATVALPPKLIPVFVGDADVRGAWGGRGSGKTRSFAKMIAVRGYIYGKAGITGQLLCARQFMNSLDDSSLEECKRAIQEEPFLAAYYEIGDRYIKSRDGRIWFSFAGLDRNIASIKSKGRILICWVDEAEAVTDLAWTVLIPTLREEGQGWNAELWVTWNPGRKGSPTDKRFKSPTDNRYRIAKLNWRDNPKFPAVLERQRLRDQEERPDEYDHIWEGAYGAIHGSILGKWVDKAERENRITQVRYDPGGAPIEISSDIGFHDTASWWFWQRKLKGFSLFGYVGASGMDAEEWIVRLDEKMREFGCHKNLGKIWLPHDARVKTFQSRHSTVERFLKYYTPKKVGIVAQSHKSDQISAARSIIDRCEFDSLMCEEGLNGLRAWQFKWNEDTQSFSKDPLHDWASHPSDGFAYGCQVMQELPAPKVKPEEPKIGIAPYAQSTVTLDQLWSDNSRS